MKSLIFMILSINFIINISLNSRQNQISKERFLDEQNQKMFEVKYNIDNNIINLKFKSDDYIITLIITTSAGIVDNFWDFIDEVDSHEVILLIILLHIHFVYLTYSHFLV